LRGVAGLIAGALCAVVIACAAGGHKSAMAPPAAAPDSMVRGSDAHSQIEQLSQEIDQQRTKLGVMPQATAMGEPPPPLPPGEDAQCHPAPSDTCRDSCTVSDSICGNAKKICELAGQLAGDPWAEGKCKDAKQTCKSAHDTCCGCQ